MKNIIILIAVLTFLFIGYADAQRISTPSFYTTYLGLKCYTDGANPGANALNGNSVLIDNFAISSNARLAALENYLYYGGEFDTAFSVLPDSVLFSSDSTDQRTFSDAKYPNKSLSNLDATSINVNLLPDVAFNRSLGTGLLPFGGIYLYQVIFRSNSSIYGTFLSPAISYTQSRNIYFPDASGTIALTSDLALYATVIDPTFTDTLTITGDGYDPVIITPAAGIGGGTGIRTGETVQIQGDSPSVGFVKGANISDLVPPTSMTGNWDWALPNKSGTVALTSDINDSLNAGYQSIYTGEQIDSLLALVSTGSVDSNVVNDLIEIYLTDSSYASSYTGAQIDSLLGLAGTALQPVDSNLYATQYDLSQVSGGSTRTKSAFDIVTPGINDSLMVFWLDDGITIDSMKVETTDSIAIQVGYDKGTDYEGPPLYLFSEGTLIISSSTFTTADFSTYSLEVDDKAYLYFTFVSSATTRLKIKIYWRYL